MAQTSQRGDWMQTFSGQQVYPLDPRPEEITIEDVAHSLALQCRFAGHVQSFYSVAEHSVRVSLVCDPEDALAGLLHDAPEAYLVDLPRPIKRHWDLRAYRGWEARWAAVIAEKYGLETLTPNSVERAEETFVMRFEELFHGGAA